MKASQEFPRLYVILDAALAGERLLRVAQECAEAGVRLMQYRAKGASARELFSACRELLQILDPRGVRLIVNDRPDVAALAGAGGAHVGQDDLDPADARLLCPLPSWVGVSTHTQDQVRAADATPVDYIAVGPLFPTRTKEKLEPIVGAQFVRRAREITRKTLVVIGGITLENVVEAFRTGADSVALARDVVATEHPGARVREILELAAGISTSARQQT
jgi:thiamine-phosphate pyrophosphorylase